MITALAAPLPPALKAQVDAVRFVVRSAPDLVPCAMTIGPFSLMTTLLEDPISAVYLASTGATANDEPAVALLDVALELSMRAVERSLRAQLAAGAKLAVLCEPAVNKVYLSPRQMKAGPDAFDRLVMSNLKRYKAVLEECGADLFLHDCGELTDAILSRLVELSPAILSLGSSERLWEAAKIVPPSTVLYGNLPSKQFYSDRVITEAEVAKRANELIGHMDETAGPSFWGPNVMSYMSAAPKMPYGRSWRSCPRRGASRRNRPPHSEPCEVGGYLIPSGVCVEQSPAVSAADPAGRVRRSRRASARQRPTLRALPVRVGKDNVGPDKS